MQTTAYFPPMEPLGALFIQLKEFPMAGRGHSRAGQAGLGGAKELLARQYEKTKQYFQLLAFFGELMAVRPLLHGKM